MACWDLANKFRILVGNEMTFACSSTCSPKCCCAELIEGGGVAGRIVVVAVTLGPHSQVIPVHRVQANNPTKENTIGYICLYFVNIWSFRNLKHSPKYNEQWRQMGF